MGHPETKNATPFAFEPIFVGNEDGRPVLVPLVRATFDITPAGLVVAAAQAPVCLAGEPYGDPETSSYRYEPECLLPKPATDVVLVGSAAAPRPGVTEVLVAFQVGPLRKGVRVVGDRGFFRSVGGVGMSKALPFERIPLVWERAFGGWDRSNPDEKKHECEYRNPVGVGFRGSGARWEEGLRCPNLEDPARPFKGWGDRPPPAGFGFVSASWEPRRKLGGTYDERWQKERAPLLPKDFTRAFLSSASPGLTAPGYLRGDEQVVVAGVRADVPVAFRLPGVPPPDVTVVRTRDPDQVVHTRLDTVIVDTDAGKVFMLWKGELVLRREPLEVRAMKVGTIVSSPSGRTAA